MTRDEIGKMRETSPAAFNAAVAEKVMGLRKHRWVIEPLSTGAILRCDCGHVLCSPPWDTIAADGFCGHGITSADMKMYPHKFADDPTADYSVLKLVRETWTERQQKQMADELDRIYETRNEFALLAYRPGDHAEAALRVRTADAEGGK